MQENPSCKIEINKMKHSVIVNNNLWIQYTYISRDINQGLRKNKNCQN